MKKKYIYKQTPPIRRHSSVGGQQQCGCQAWLWLFRVQNAYTGLVFSVHFVHVMNLHHKMLDFLGATNTETDT